MGSARVKLIYEGIAITQGDDVARPDTYMLDTSGDLLSFAYSDSIGGKLDDLQVSFRDSNGYWRSEWRPRKGSLLRASLLPAFGDGELVCGDMWIDEIEVGGPLSVATIKAVSAPIGDEIRGTKRTRAWESVTLKQMAQKIAEDASLELSYSGDDVEIERVDQSHESDLVLLARLGSDYGYLVKVAGGKLVVYDQELLEDADSVAVVDVSKGDDMVTNWRVRSKTRAIYRAARVMYRDPIRKFVAEALKDHERKTPPEPVFVAPKKRGKRRRLTNAQKKAREQARQDRAEKRFEKKHDRYLDSLIRQSREEERRAGREVELDDVEFLYTPSGEPVVGAVLEIEKRVKDFDAAKRLAQRKLREANRDEVTLTMDLVGDVGMRAGLNIDLVGAGDFSGKYHLDRTRHELAGGRPYTTALEGHRVLLYG